MAIHAKTLTSTGQPPTCAKCGTRTTSRARQVESIAHCTQCGEDVCWIDGISLANHDRCPACQVLVGKHHATTHMLDGLCPSCARWRAKGIPLPDEMHEEELAVGG